MLYKFTKKIIHDEDEPEQCANNITNKLKSAFNFKPNDKNPNGHLSINHEKNHNHTIWLFLYEETGIFESELNKQIVKVKSDKVIKFKGKLPTLEQVKKAI